MGEGSSGLCVQGCLHSVATTGTVDCELRESRCCSVLYCDLRAQRGRGSARVCCLRGRGTNEWGKERAGPVASRSLGCAGSVRALLQSPLEAPVGGDPRCDTGQPRPSLTLTHPPAGSCRRGSPGRAGAQAPSTGALKGPRGAVPATLSPWPLFSRLQGHTCKWTFAAHSDGQTGFWNLYQLPLSPCLYLFVPLLICHPSP